MTSVAFEYSESVVRFSGLKQVVYKTNPKLCTYLPVVASTAYQEEKPFHTSTRLCLWRRSKRSWHIFKSSLVADHRELGCISSPTLGIPKMLNVAFCGRAEHCFKCKPLIGANPPPRETYLLL